MPVVEGSATDVVTVTNECHSSWSLTDDSTWMLNEMSAKAVCRLEQIALVSDHHFEFSGMDARHEDVRPVHDDV